MTDSEQFYFLISLPEANQPHKEENTCASNQTGDWEKLAEKFVHGELPLRNALSASAGD